MRMPPQRAARILEELITACSQLVTWYAKHDLKYFRLAAAAVIKGIGFLERDLEEDERLAETMRRDFLDGRYTRGPS